jgi:hypothetical protein
MCTRRKTRIIFIPRAAFFCAKCSLLYRVFFALALCIQLPQRKRPVILQLRFSAFSSWRYLWGHGLISLRLEGVWHEKFFLFSSVALPTGRRERARRSQGKELKLEAKLGELRHRSVLPRFATAAWAFIFLFAEFDLFDNSML